MRVFVFALPFLVFLFCVLGYACKKAGAVQPAPHAVSLCILMIGVGWQQALQPVLQLERSVLHSSGSVQLMQYAREWQ